MIALLLPFLLAPASVPSQTPPKAYTVEYPLKVDIDGDGTPDPVKIEYGGFIEDCAREITLVAGKHRTAIWHKSGGIWLEKGPPTTKTIALKAIRQRAKRGAPRTSLILAEHGPTCSSEYTSWFELAYGKHFRKVFGLKAGAFAEIWESYGYDPKAKVRRDGTWEVERYKCVRSAEYVSDWEDGKTAKVKRMGKEQRITERFRWQDGAVKSRVVRTRTLRSKCGGQRFCPFVYVGDPPRKVGEILRDQVGRAAWRDDRLRLPAVTDDHLVVRLAEKKPDEITYLDAIWIEVDGERRVPTGCAGAWCRVDGRTHRMLPGDRLEVRFDGLRPGQRVVLGANGYYTLGETRDRSLKR